MHIYYSKYIIHNNINIYYYKSTFILIPTLITFVNPYRYLLESYIFDSCISYIYIYYLFI